MDGKSVLVGEKQDASTSPMKTSPNRSKRFMGLFQCCGSDKGESYGKSEWKIENLKNTREQDVFSDENTSGESFNGEKVKVQLVRMIFKQDISKFMNFSMVKFVPHNENSGLVQ